MFGRSRFHSASSSHSLSASDGTPPTNAKPADTVVRHLTRNARLWALIPHNDASIMRECHKIPTIIFKKDDLPFKRAGLLRSMNITEKEREKKKPDSSNFFFLLLLLPSFRFIK